MRNEKSAISANVLRFFIAYIGATIQYLFTEKTLTQIVSVDDVLSVSGYRINVDLSPIILPNLVSQSGLYIPASSVLTVGLGTAEVTSNIRINLFDDDY